MFNITHNNIRQVMKICTMYYFDGLNQQEIAKRIGLSRSQVCKILLAARKKEIVKISINNPYSNESQYEQKLLELFSLDDALVVDSSGSAFDEISLKIAKSLTPLLDGLIKDGSIIGLSSGISINKICEDLDPINKKGLSVIPLTGGGNVDRSKWQSNMSAQILAQKWNAEYYPLYAPGFVKSKESRDILLQEPSIRDVLNRAKSCDIALLGIGSVIPSASVFASGYLSKQDYEELNQIHAAAGICNIFFDIEGQLVPFSGHERMIGLDASDIKKIHRRIGIGFGTSKASAILAALKGKWVNYLVTDVQTAKQVLGLSGSVLHED